MNAISTDQLSAYLKSQTRGIPLAKRFQMVNRPRICPLDELIALVPRGRRVMDIGCGNGTLLVLLARYRSPSHLMGIDVNADAVKWAHRLLAQCCCGGSYGVDVFDGQSPPAVMQTAEYLFLVDVLHHVAPLAQKAFLKSLFDRMSSGAALVLKDIDAARRILEKFNVLHDLIVARQKVHAIHASQAEQWLSDIGFDISPVKKQRRLWYPHYTIVARKP